MKGSTIKKLSLGIALAMICSAFTACSTSDSKNNNGEKGTEATTQTSAETEGASWWTKEQKETIDSLEICDEGGFLYEVDYSADYDLDKIIESGAKTSNMLRKGFKDLYLPDSEYDIPNPIYGGCSGFATKDADGNQIMGRNYDWDINLEVSLVVHTSPKNGYKSVGMTDLGFTGVSAGFETNQEKERVLYAPIFTTDGINEKGLTCTVLILDEKGVYQNSDKQDVVTSMVVRLLLDKTATVKEAEELLNKYDIVSAFYANKFSDPNQGKNFHWLVTDKTGDSAVFEFVDNKLVVNRTPVDVESDFGKMTDINDISDINEQVKISYPKKDTGYQLVTNFYVSEGAENTIGEGFWRYQTLKNKLEENPNPTKEEAMKYLEAVRFYKNDVDTSLLIKGQGQDPDDYINWGWFTVWSEIYDTENLTMDVCIHERYNKTYHFKIK